MGDWVVRVIVFPTPSLEKTAPRLDSFWLEQFRFMGLIFDHGDLANGAQMFDILPPKAMCAGFENSKAWAESVAPHLESFGYSAVAAPKWRNAFGGD